MALWNIIVDIGARTAGIESALTRVEGRLSSFSSAVGKIGGVVGVGAIASFADHILALGAEIEHSSQKAGVTAAAFQQLSFAAKQSGVDAGQLDNALIRMNRALSLASTGAKAPSDALHALGLSFADLKDLTPDKQLELLADRISKLPTPADKARAEIVFFGRAGGELGAFMMKGAEGIEAMRKQAESLGLVMSDETVKRLEEAHKAVDRLAISFHTLAGNILAFAAPKIQYALDHLLEMGKGEKFDMLALASHPESSSGPPRMSPDMLKSRLDSISGTAPPGFQPDQLQEFHPTLKRTSKKSGGVYSLLQQWDEETVKIEDDAYALYDMTNLKLKELLAAGNIDLAEFTRRSHEAAVRYQSKLDELQPVIITAKKVIDIPGIEIALRTFTDDVKVALHQTVSESGNFGKNLLHNILQALEDRAIFRAIDDIGNALYDVLKSASAGAAGSGFWGQLLNFAVGVFAPGSNTGLGSTGSAAGGSGGGVAGARASGGFVASHKTYLIGERGPELFTPSGSGNVTPSDQLGGAFTFAPTYNINAPNGDQQLRNALPGLLAATAARSKRDMLEAFRRNNLPSPRAA